MPYATPTQFIAKFGLAETAQMLADEQQLLTPLLLTDAIAGTWTGTPSADEQAAATAALARITRQLDVSSNYMDGYLRSAFTLPIAPDTANAGVLEDCVLALTRCGLADDTDNATERIDEACKTWRSWLKDVQAGRAQLVGTDGEAPAVAGGVRTGQATTAYNWAAFPGGSGGYTP